MEIRVLVVAAVVAVAGAIPLEIMTEYGRIRGKEEFDPQITVIPLRFYW